MDSRLRGNDGGVGVGGGSVSGTGDHKGCPYGRLAGGLFSEESRAPSSSASAGATQTFITPFNGARYEMRDPSWLILTDVRSGFPNNTLLDISSGS